MHELRPSMSVIVRKSEIIKNRDVISIVTCHKFSKFNYQIEWAKRASSNIVRVERIVWRPCSVPINISNRKIVLSRLAHLTHDLRMLIKTTAITVARSVWTFHLLNFCTSWSELERALTFIRHRRVWCVLKGNCESLWKHSGKIRLKAFEREKLVPSLEGMRSRSHNL